MHRQYWTPWDAIVDRLQNSRSPQERSSLYLGQSYEHGYPVLLDRDLLFEHMHILGPTGTGKTSIAVESLVIQLIRSGEGPVVIFDCKGSPELFHTVMEEAKRNGRKFKWFTNTPYRSTYVFNPWDQKLLSRLTLSEILGLITQSLNLHHGEDYGRAWFSVVARTLLKRAIQETLPSASKYNLLSNPRQQGRLFPKYAPIQSFRDLYGILRDLAHDSDEFQAAQHLAFVVESLADFEQLNLAPNIAPNHSALAHAIHMPEVIREKQVVYFYLVGAMDVASVAELARLGLYSLLMGAMDYCDEHREAPRIYSVWDEAQVMIAKNIENVLTQSRSHGLACVFAHQAVSQLNPPGGVDLRELVMGGTTVKWIFAARDPWLQQYIVNTSGTARYFRQSYDVSAEDVLTGMVGPEYALCDARSPAAIHVSEYTGPRITVQDILNASYDPNLSLLWIARASGLSRFRGWFPVYSDWPIPLDVHKDRLRSKWPATTDEHLEITSDWPNESEQTITATTHPPLSLDEQTDLANRKLDALRRKLEKK